MSRKVDLRLCVFLAPLRETAALQGGAQLICVICEDYNALHLLARPQIQTPRFTGNPIVHTSWCKES